MIDKKKQEAKKDDSGSVTATASIAAGPRRKAMQFNHWLLIIEDLVMDESLYTFVFVEIGCYFVVYLTFCLSVCLFVMVF